MRRLCITTLILGAAACGGPSDSMTQANIETGSGRLGLTISASNASGAAADGLARIVVNISEVRVHGPDGWTTISSTPVEVDLLALGDSSASLGFADLEPGAYKQVRLVVAEGSASFVETEDGEQIAMKTPSGEQSGLKLKGNFDVAECGLTQVGIDLDAKKSIHVHSRGNNKGYILRPVIRTVLVDSEGDLCGDGEPGDGEGNPGDVPPGEGTNDGTDPGTGTIPGDGSDPGDGSNPGDGNDPSDGNDGPPASEPGGDDPTSGGGGGDPGGAGGDGGGNDNPDLPDV